MRNLPPPKPSGEVAMQRSNAVFADWLNLILAVLLVISPWAFGFPAGAATANAVVFGIVIGALAIAALAAFARWEEWINLIAGLWVLIAPFVLGFAGITAALWTHVIIGIAVAVLAAVELRMVGGYGSPREVTH